MHQYLGFHTAARRRSFSFLTFVCLPNTSRKLLPTPPAARGKRVAIFLFTYWHRLSSWDFLLCYFKFQEHHHQALSGTKLCRIVTLLPLAHSLQTLPQSTSYPWSFDQSEMLEIHARTQPHTPQLPFSMGMPLLRGKFNQIPSCTTSAAPFGVYEYPNMDSTSLGTLVTI